MQIRPSTERCFSCSIQGILALKISLQLGEECFHAFTFPLPHQLTVREMLSIVGQIGKVSMTSNDMEKLDCESDGLSSQRHW